MSNYSAIDMTTAAAQGFRDGVASVANSAIPNNQGASAAQPASVVPEGYLPPQCTDKSKHVKYRAGWNDALVAVSRLRMTQKPSLSCPDGYALVPIEPTPEMVNAALEYSTGIDPRSIVIEDYKAMLAAAPAQGQQVECRECERLRAMLTDWEADANLLEKERDEARAELSALKAHPEAYQFDGQVLRDEHGNYLAEFMAYEQSFIDRLLHPQPELKAQQVWQEPQRCQCCGYLVTESEHRGCLRAAAPQPAPAQDVAGLLEWAVDRWHAEVASRPLANVHRRSLDDTWRQVIRKLGGDAGLLCGPAHDALAAHDKQSGGE